MQKIIISLFITCIRFYQVALSPFFGQQCRFTPSCSQYGIEALRAHGVIQGLWLTIKRLARCNPWHHGGHDPVPK